jgi:hypothetical protein
VSSSAIAAPSVRGPKWPAPAISRTRASPTCSATYRTESTKRGCDLAPLQQEDGNADAGEFGRIARPGSPILLRLPKLLQEDRDALRGALPEITRPSLDEVLGGVLTERGRGFDEHA